MPQSTESEVIEGLVSAGAAGDRQAQQELLERYWHVIRQVVRARKHRMGRALKLREETDDLEQRVALELLQSLPKQKWQGKKAFVAWVRKLAEYEMRDAQRYHRRKKRDRGAETSGDKIDLGQRQGRSPESRIDDKRRLDGLMKSIEGLKPEYGAALVLHYKGYTHSQIGELLDCSAEAARKLVARARAKLAAGDER